MKLHLYTAISAATFVVAAQVTGCSASTGGGGGTGSGSGSGSSSGSSSGGTPPPGCTPDDTLGCTGNAQGFSCAPGDNPEAEDSTLSCGSPQTDATTGGDDYCCFTWTSSTSCAPDDTITAVCPQFDSYGYKCASPTDDPTSLDASLNCSSGVADADGTSTDFCCKLQ
jgi:hypothetical protein